MPAIAEQQLSEAIRRTVLWFSLFDYPLTASELSSYLPLRATTLELATALTSLPNGITQQNGFYFPASKPELISERQKRYNYSDRKFRRTQRLLNLFGRLPWIKLVAMANLIGAHNLRDQGDIDLFIITAPRRLWLTRLLLAGSLKLLNLRPTDRHSRDTFCLSFLVSLDGLELEKLRLADDLYFSYWLAGLTPIINKGQAYSRLISQNAWLTAQLPNWQPLSPSGRRCLILKDKHCDSAFGDWLENLVYRWQLERLPANLQSLLNQDTRVMASDRIIKLHANDRRRQFIENFQHLAL